MVAQCFFSTQNLASTADVVASGSLGVLTPDFAVQLPVSKPWRSNAGSGTLDITLASSASIEVVAIAFPRFYGALTPLPSDTIRVRIDPSGGTLGAGTLWDSNSTPSSVFTLIPGLGLWVGFLPAAVTGRLVRITVGTTGVAFDLGYVFIGALSRILIGPGIGTAQEWLDGSQSEVGDSSGIEYIDPGERRRQLTLPFGMIDPADRIFFDNLSALRGMGSPMLFGLSTTNDPARNTMICRISQPVNIQVTQPYGFSSTLQLTESL